MTTTAANNLGRASGPLTRLLRRCVPALMLAATFASGAASAENVLEKISYNTLPGGKVEVTLQLSSTPGDPQVFTTDTPPRIALDLADTRSALSQRSVEINTGSTTSVSAVEAAGRTRVVVDLVRPSSYESKIDGRNLVLTIGNGVTGSSAATAMIANDPNKAVAARGVEVSNIDFRRGKNGEGRIVVTFSGEGATTDVKRDGDNITLDLYNAQLPSNLAQRLDLLDFATPVQFVEARARGNGARLEISAKGPYEQLAYQSGNEYVLEIAPKKADAEKKKDKNAEPEYTGARVTFNFQDIPTRSVLQLIADVSDLNIVVADTVTGNVTLRLINVPWDQALDLVLQAKGLDKRRRDNVIWVAPQKEIADREQALEDARIALEQRVELDSAYIKVSYGKAKDIAALLQNRSSGGAGAGGGGAGGGQNQTLADTTRGFLSSRGSVTFDERTNTLLVNDTPEKIREIRDLVLTLDRPVQQVLIESRIVIATDDFAKELGVRFGVSGGYEDNNGNVVTLSGTQVGADTMANVALNNRFNGERGTPVSTPRVPFDENRGIFTPSLGNRLGVNLPAASPAGSFGLAILGADYLLDLELSAAQTEARGEVISSPRVITANQQEAVIKQGQEIGYVTFQQGSGGGGQATVNFKDAVLELKVTPTITNDERVVLALNVKKDNIAALVPNPGGGFVPQIDKREINTTVLVDDGQTVVLGGVYEVESRDDIKKVPFLGDIPGVGALFRNKKNSNEKAELLIFVTPRILNESLK